MDVEVVAAMDLKVIICPTRPEVPIPEPAGRLVIFKTMVDTGPKMALANIPQQYTAPMVVDYGQVVYYRTIVCASAENGLTCWNTDTGHGAFMNRQTTLFF